MEYGKHEEIAMEQDVRVTYSHPQALDKRSNTIDPQSREVSFKAKTTTTIDDELAEHAIAQALLDAFLPDWSTSPVLKDSSGGERNSLPKRSPEEIARGAGFTKLSVHLGDQSRPILS